jgi:hypothetical protein
MSDDSWKTIQSKFSMFKKLVIVAAADDFVAGALDQDSLSVHVCQLRIQLKTKGSTHMLKLSGIRALDIIQRMIHINDAVGYQAVHLKQRVS